MRQTSVLLFLSVMAMALGQTLVFTILPLLGRAVGLREIQVGVIITLSSIVYATAARFWGRQSDHLGRRRVMIIGLSGYALGTLIFASLFYVGMKGWLAGYALWLCLIVARCGQSMIMAGTMPAANAYTSDITTVETRTAGMARLGAANSTGTIIGPACGGLLAAFNLLTPLLFAALATALCALLVRWRLPESPRHVAALESTGGQVSRKLGYWDVRYRQVLLVAVLMLVSFSVVQQTLAFYFQDILHLSSRAAAAKVGLAMMMSAIIALLVQTALARWLRWPASRLTLGGMVALLTGSATLAMATAQVPLFLGVGLCGLGIGLAFPACLAMASLSVSAEEQGALAGITSSVPAIGSIIGPVLGTALYQFKPSAPYLTNILILLPALWLGWRLQRRERPVG